MANTHAPLVSIITCFLNEERFLQETVESVLTQEYTHWELLLVDDGSSDRSTQIAKDYAARHPEKIYYHDHEGHDNLGLSASRNSGIEKAKGSLVAFLDADDVWLPQKLSQQVNIMQEHLGVGMLCEASEYWYSWEDSQKNDIVIQVGGGLPDGVYYPPKLMLLLYPLSNTAAPCPSGLMCRKATLLQHGGFEAHFTGSYQMYEDQGFLSKMYLNEPVYVSRACHNRYRQRTGSLVQSVTEDGKYHAVRQYYLEWLQKYIKQQHIQHPQINKLLRKALMPYRQPVLHFITNTLPKKGKALFWKSKRE